MPFQCPRSIPSLALALLLAGACRDPEPPSVTAPDAAPEPLSAPAASPDAAPAAADQPAPSVSTAAPLTLDEIRRLYEEADGNPTRIAPVKEQLLRYLVEHPDDPTALTLLSQVQLEQGRMDESLATAERCIAVAAETAACWLTIAVITETQGSDDRALEGYRRYLELAPEGRYASDVRTALDRLGAPVPAPGSTSATVLGDIDSTAVKTLLEARLSLLRFCYDVALKANPELAGKITYTVSIDALGRVLDVTIENDTLGSPKVAACTKAKIKGWRLGAQEDSGELTFTVAFASE